MNIYWLCCFGVLFGTSSCSSESFQWCVSHYTFGVEFYCAQLDKNVLHRNYFDNDNTNYTCQVYDTHYKEVNRSFTSAASITLRNCRLPTLPQKFLQRLDRVKEINLDASEIKSIDEKTFQFPDECAWEQLSMFGNDLTELPPTIFSKTPNISEIDFSRNRIRNVDPNAFRGSTTHLQIIMLSHNSIEALDKSLFTHLINLKELYLNYNFIEHFPLDLSESKDLSTLQLDNNKIVRLDCNIFDLSTNKIAINVNFNHIVAIDFNCDGHLESLELYANHNQLTNLTFPKSNLLNGLATIDVSRNVLDRVTFQPILPQLRELYLNENNLKELSDWKDTRFPKLRRIDFSNNLFNCSYLSSFLKNFPQRIHLGISEHQTGRSKTIHGINCADDKDYVESGHSETIVGAGGIVAWCLFTFLCLIVAIFGFVKIYKNRRNRLADAEQSIYHENIKC